MKRTEWPSAGDLVVAKIKRVLNYGAIAELQEYPDKEGFIHISQVTSSWVKNIRSFVSEGQIRVAQVTRVDPEKNTVDISLRKVTQQQEKRKNNEWRREKRADKLFERICHELKEPVDKSFKQIAFKLEDEFGDFLSVFEKANVEGEKALAGIDIPDNWKKAIVKHAKESVTVPEVSLHGILTLTSNAGNGVELIKKALNEAATVKNVKLEYVSAPQYRVQVRAQDYVTAEKLLRKASQAAIDSIKKEGGEGSFEKIKT